MQVYIAIPGDGTADGAHIHKQGEEGERARRYTDVVLPVVAYLSLSTKNTIRELVLVGSLHWAAGRPGTWCL